MVDDGRDASESGEADLVISVSGWQPVVLGLGASTGMWLSALVWGSRRGELRWWALALAGAGTAVLIASCVRRARQQQVRADAAGLFTGTSFIAWQDIGAIVEHRDMGARVVRVLAPALRTPDQRNLPAPRARGRHAERFDGQLAELRRRWVAHRGDDWSPPPPPAPTRWT